jgi:hypothetical protein
MPEISAAKYTITAPVLTGTALGVGINKGRKSQIFLTSVPA